MTPYNFLKQVRELKGNGDGYIVRLPVNIIGDMRTTGALTLTAATAPTVAAIETNAVGIVVAASTTAAGTMVWCVPPDYDQVSDYFKIKVLANSAGATNAPTLTATVYRKRALTALSADLAPTASAAIASSASPAAIATEVTITCSSKGLRPGDILTINLVTGAHTTDAVNIYGVWLEYKTLLVAYDETARA